MFTCGFVRSNFSLPMSAPVLAALGSCRGVAVSRVVVEIDAIARSGLAAIG
jgi:hypothetical protein